MRLAYLRIGVVMAVGAALLVLDAGPALGAPRTGQRDDKAPINVGIELELSGTFAPNGDQIRDGWELAQHDFGSSVDGHKIEGSFFNEENTPALALNGAKHFAQEGVALVEGPTASNTAGEVAQYLGQQGIPDDDVALCSTQQYQAYQKYGEGFTTSWTCDQPSFAAAQWALQQGYKHVTTIGMDYSFGWESVGTFIAAFEKGGGTIDDQIWAPITAVTYSSYVSQVPSNTDAVFALVAGAASPKLTAAWGAFGLSKSIPLFGNTTLFDQSVLPGETAKSVVGLKMSAQYCTGIDNKVNQHFVAEVHKKYDDYPGYYTYTGYTRYQRLVAALKEVHGNVSNHKKFLKALESAKFNGPTGVVTLNKTTDSPVQNIYICEVRTEGGSLRNVPIKTFKDVEPWGTLGKSGWLSVFKKDGVGRPS